MESNKSKSFVDVAFPESSIQLSDVLHWTNVTMSGPDEIENNAPNGHNAEDHTGPVHATDVQLRCGNWREEGHDEHHPQEHERQNVKYQAPSSQVEPRVQRKYNMPIKWRKEIDITNSEVKLLRFPVLQLEQKRWIRVRNRGDGNDGIRRSRPLFDFILMTMCFL